MSLNQPEWRVDLNLHERLKTTFIIEGNVHDLQVWIDPESQSIEHIRLNEYLYRHLREKGYDSVVFYNPLEGFHNDFAFGREQMDSFFRIAGSGAKNCETIGAASKCVRTAMQDQN